jgi:hypothetical protein
VFSKLAPQQTHIFIKNSRISLSCNKKQFYHISLFTQLWFHRRRGHLRRPTMGTSEGAFCCLILKHPIPVILNKRREREMGQQENKRKERDGTTGIGHLGSFDGDAVNQNIIEETNRNLVEILSDSDLSNPDGRDPLRLRLRL